MFCHLSIHDSFTGKKLFLAPFAFETHIAQLGNNVVIHHIIAMDCTTTHCGVVQISTEQYVWNSTAQNNSVEYSTAQHSTIKAHHSTVQCSTVHSQRKVRRQTATVEQFMATRPGGMKCTAYQRGTVWRTPDRQVARKHSPPKCTHGADGKVPHPTTHAMMPAPPPSVSQSFPAEAQE